MFGLSMLQERLAFLGVLVAVVVGFAWHERGIGSQKCVTAAAAVVAQQEVKNASQEKVDESTVKKEGDQFRFVLAQPVAEPVHARMCINAPLRSSAVPGASSTGLAVAGEPAVSEADHQSVVRGPDIGPRLQAVGEHADGQVTGLLAYIHDVCRPK